MLKHIFLNIKKASPKANFKLTCVEAASFSQAGCLVFMAMPVLEYYISIIIRTVVFTNTSIIKNTRIIIKNTRNIAVSDQDGWTITTVKLMFS